MKRILLVCVAIMIATLLLPTQSYASGTTHYYINECDISVDVPNDLITVTREIDENDTALQQLQISKAELLDILEDRGIYLDATTSDGVFELWISTVKMDYDVNLNDISDEKILSEFGSILDKSNTGAIKYSSLSIYKSPTQKYIKAYGTPIEGDTPNSTIQYMTAYNKHYIYVAGASYDGPITCDQELQLQAMVDNVTFGKESSGSKISDNMESNLTYKGYEYKDQESHAAFFVPRNWYEVPFDTAPKILSKKFVNADDTKFTIMYGSIDCYPLLSNEERSRYTRDSIDNSYFFEDGNESDLFDITGFDTGEVSSRTYNGNDYITITGSYNYDSDGFNISFPAEGYIHLENGWMYIFEYIGSADSEHYSDFESLLNSVKYPIPTVSSNATSTTLGHDSTSNAHLSSYAVIIVLCACAVFTLIGLFIYFSRYKPSKNKANSEIELSNPSVSENQIKYCYRCGSEIRFNNKYCSNCGTSLRQDSDK